MSSTLRVTTRNARFQQWQALLGNRKKRQRAGGFFVQGVRPITMAVERGWPIVEVLFDADRPPSSWAQRAREAAARAGAEEIAVAGALLAELGGKDPEATEPPELLVIARLGADNLSRIPGPGAAHLQPQSTQSRSESQSLAVVLDRPSSPGNVGTVVRSVDAFGGSGVIVVGHAADPYDPRAVRASTGSLFSVPVVRVGSPQAVVDWARPGQADADADADPGEPVRIVGTDEHGDVDLHDCDLTRPTLLVIGNETSGLSAAWREHCDAMVRIPIAGTASSLNAAVAASVVLYEASRQRRS